MSTIPPRLFTSLRYDPILLESLENAYLSGPQWIHSPLYMLRYHRDRVLNAAKEFKLDPVVEQLENHEGLLLLDKIIMDHVHEVEKHQGKIRPLKIRVVFGPDHTVDVDSSEVPPVTLQDLFPLKLADPGGDSKAELNKEQSEKLANQSKQDVLNSSLDVERPRWTAVLDYKRTTPSPFTRFKTLQRKDYNAARTRAKINSFQEPREVLLVGQHGEVMEGSLTSVYFHRGGRWVTPPLTSGGQAGTTRLWALEQGLCVNEVILASDLKEGEECYLSNGVRGFFRGYVQRECP
ncbi:MAG: hypothetical protein M1823_000986 [Watsoniomyces obsoletus]|nr:MAG: hypothetical protein M1823_000986 [Watsoniomyces obsoletus]